MANPRNRRGKTAYNPIDIHVGNRVRVCRKLQNLSQAELGDKIGISYQQLQKCEKGTNRIGASRLFALGEVLGVPVSYFFEDMPDLTVYKSLRDVSSHFNEQLVSVSSGTSIGGALQLFHTPDDRWFEAVKILGEAVCGKCAGHQRGTAHCRANKSEMNPWILKCGSNRVIFEPIQGDGPISDGVVDLVEETRDVGDARDVGPTVNHSLDNQSVVGVEVESKLFRAAPRRGVGSAQRGDVAG